MKEEMTVKEQFGRIWEGLTTHCRDLSEFMGEHLDDPFFKTEVGKRLAGYSIHLTTNHVMGLMELRKDDFKEVLGEKGYDDTKKGIEGSDCLLKMIEKMF